MRVYDKNIKTIETALGTDIVEVIDPFIGLSATYSTMHRDYALTVVNVEGKKGNRKITLTRDEYKPMKDHDHYGVQKFSYKSVSLQDASPYNTFYFFEKDNQADKGKHCGYANCYRPSSFYEPTGRFRKDTFGWIHLGFKECYFNPEF